MEKYIALIIALAVIVSFSGSSMYFIYKYIEDKNNKPQRNGDLLMCATAIIISILFSYGMAGNFFTFTGICIVLIATLLTWYDICKTKDEYTSK
jgi:uncharacterized membrane-anchored protein